MPTYLALLFASAILLAASTAGAVQGSDFFQGEVSSRSQFTMAGIGANASLGLVELGAPANAVIVRIHIKGNSTQHAYLFRFGVATSTAGPYTVYSSSSQSCTLLSWASNFNVSANFDITQTEPAFPLTASFVGLRSTTTYCSGCGAEPAAQVQADFAVSGTGLAALRAAADPYLHVGFTVHAVDRNAACGAQTSNAAPKVIAVEISSRLGSSDSAEATPSCKYGLPSSWQTSAQTPGCRQCLSTDVALPYCNASSITTTAAPDTTTTPSPNLSSSHAAAPTVGVLAFLLIGMVVAVVFA